MAAIESTDYSSIFLILGSFEGIDNVLERSDNSLYEFRPVHDDPANWKGGQHDELFAPFLRLVFGKNMWSPEGWVIGSSPDTEQCDIQLVGNITTAISRRHLIIDLHPAKHCPRITALSHNAVKIHTGDAMKTLLQGESFEIISPVTIDLGEVKFKAWCPVLTSQEEQSYRRNLEKFDEEIMNAIPKFALRLNDNKYPTPDLRFGRNNAVYIREKGGDVSTGSAASVMKVREILSQKIFAAKVPHYKASDSFGRIRHRWESLTREFRNITSLQHMSEPSKSKIVQTMSQPHIVRAFEVLTGDHREDPPWLIMEWIENDLNSIDLDSRNITTLLVQVTKGVKCIHSHEFAHRDLKPANILVKLKDSRLIIAKIADFGTTKHDLFGKMQTYTGTSIYMAPEFWEQELAYTRAIDMWSLGVIAIELLTDWDSKLDAWDSKFGLTKTQHSE